MTETATRPVDPNDFLMGGGDGVPSAKFAEPGETVAGVIQEFKAYQEREYNKETKRSDGPGKTFPSGDPIMGIAIDLQTAIRDPFVEGDTGLRRVYLQGKNMKQTVREAIVAGGGTGLAKGANLSITFTHRDDPMDKGSAKNYTAVFTTAANVQMMGGAPAPAPTVAAPVAAQPVVAPAPAVVAPAPAPAAPAPAPAAPAGDPVSTARQLIAIPGMSDAQIAAATGLDVVVIGAIRNAG